MDDSIGESAYALRPVGRVESSLVDRNDAPRQETEGAPGAWLVLTPEVAQAARDLEVDNEVILLTWLDRADRDVQVVHPQGDQQVPLTGVFSTRSPDRPNPVGLHTVTILEIDGPRLRVDHLEAINGTPIIDIKPVLRPRPQR